MEISLNKTFHQLSFFSQFTFFSLIRAKVLLSVVLVLFIANTHATPTIDFQPEVSQILSSTDPSSVVVKDFNNDGHEDFAVVMSATSGGDGSVSVLLGDGTGGFANEDFKPTNYNPWGIGACDFNRDGVLDLALTTSVDATGYFLSDVNILLGDGAGRFTYFSTTKAPTTKPLAVSCGDFNEDGVLDLVVGTQSTTSLHIGKGDGSFADGTEITVAHLLDGSDIEVADFNKDGHLDFANRAAVFLGKGDGGFSRSTNIGNGVMAVGDINSDGILDTVSINGGNLQVWFGDGTGKFVFNKSYIVVSAVNGTVSADLADVAIADLNNDGQTDVAIAIANNSPGTEDMVAVLLGTGNGLLQGPVNFITGKEPKLAAVGDWNEDGYADLAAPYRNLGDTPYASILIQNPGGGTVAQPGKFHFSSAGFSVSETAASIAITVVRSGGSSGSASVNYATADGTATAGKDYTATSGVLNFADGETSKTFNVPIIDDAIYEGDEIVNLTLSNPTGGAGITTPKTTVLTIVENDQPPPAGVLQFSNVNFEGAENDGSVTIVVERIGGSIGNVSVNYATADGTATEGQDYIGSSDTLTFADGVTSQTLAVTLLDDQIYEGNETVKLSLSNITGGAVLGTTSEATLTVNDNDTQTNNDLNTDANNGKKSGGGSGALNPVMFLFWMFFIMISNRWMAREV